MLSETYRQTHNFNIYRMQDSSSYGWPQGVRWVTAINSGLLFPRFLEADFSSFEQWRDFVEDFGLEGFSYLYDKGTYTVKSEIERLKQGSLAYLPTSFLKRVHGHIQDGLADEQQAMQLFHTWFVDKKVPISFAQQVEEFSVVSLMSVDEWNPKSRAVKEWSKIRQALKKHLPEMWIRIQYDVAAGKPEPVWAFQTHPARCYMEMLDLVADGRKVKPCRLCKQHFLLTRDNEKYCSRPAPDYFQAIPQLEDGEDFKPSTCKHVGPQVIYWKKLREEKPDKLALVKTRKKLQNRIYYLQKKGDEKALDEAQEELKQLEAKAKRRK